MLNWWMQLPDPVRAASVTAVATLLAAAFGFAAIFYQLGRQSKNAIEQNRRNEALKLKVQIYEKVLETTIAAEEAIGEFTALIRNFELQLLFATAHLPPGSSPPRVPEHRYPEYSRLRSQALSALSNVVLMIERWHVVDRRLVVFRLAISMGLASHRGIILGGPDLMVYAMPVAGYEAKWQPPTPDELARYRHRMEIELYEIGRLAAWVGDFQVEMQMLLLGELFSDPIERRDPPDSEQFCIRLDRYDEIMRRIEGSEWGRRNTEAEAEAWSRFAKKNVNSQ